MQYLAALLLLSAHALLVAGASRLPEVVAPIVAASVYGPLWPLQALGVPVFAASAGGGWSNPSLLGWSILALFWGCVWTAVVRIVVHITRRG